MGNFLKNAVNFAILTFLTQKPRKKTEIPYSANGGYERMLQSAHRAAPAPFGVARSGAWK